MKDFKQLGFVEQKNFIDWGFKVQFLVVKKSQKWSQLVEIFAVWGKIPLFQYYLLQPSFHRKLISHLEQTKTGNRGHIARVFDQIIQSLHWLINGFFFYSLKDELE